MRIINIEDKIWADDRGWGMRPFELAGLSENQAFNLHTASITPNSIRGNHYHPDATEWLLVFGGDFEIAWQTQNAPAPQTQQFPSDKPILLEFSPNTANKIKKICKHNIYILAFNSKAKPETIRREILK